MWNDCPRRSAARVLRREIEDSGIKLSKERRSIGAICGTATHAAAAWSLGEKMKAGTIGDEGAATDLAVETLRETMKTEVIEWDKITMSGRMAETAVVRQVRQYRKDVAAKAKVDGRTKEAREAKARAEAEAAAAAAQDAGGQPVGEANATGEDARAPQDTREGEVRSAQATEGKVAATPADPITEEEDRQAAQGSSAGENAGGQAGADEKAPACAT